LKYIKSISFCYLFIYLPMYLSSTAMDKHIHIDTCVIQT
jgi:hypothetical protein